MKRFVFAVGVLALGFAASTPARADFSVMKFETGFCRIWWNNGMKRRLGSRRNCARFHGCVGGSNRCGQKGQVQINKSL